MNKSELIEAVAERADVPKAQAARVFDALVESVGDALANGDQVAIDAGDVTYESMCGACYLDQSSGRLG